MPSTAAEAPANAPSRSPSPASKPPVATAPGPRAQALQNIFAKALDATLKKCSYNNFADCFPTTAQYVPENLDGLHRDFVGRLGETCTENFNAVLTKRNVIPSLNALDTLLLEARKRKEQATAASPGTPVSAPIPPHTLSPETLYHSHLHPYLNAHKAELEEEVQTLQSANTGLFEEVKAQRNEIENLVKGLEQAVKELEKAANTLEGEEVIKIEEETRVVDEAMKG